MQAYSNPKRESDPHALPDLIARTVPRSHSNGAPGEWWAEYRVRRLSDAERAARPEHLWNRGMLYVLEQRYTHQQDSEYCQHHRGVWEAWDYGRTPEEAALSCAGDSHYSEAESLSPLHEAVKAKVAADKARWARITELRAVLYATWRDKRGESHTERIDVTRDEQERAQAEFERECKAARIWKAVTTDSASQDKVDAIKARVRESYETRLKVRLAEQEAAERELATLADAREGMEE